MKDTFCLLRKLKTKMKVFYWLAVLSYFICYEAQGKTVDQYCKEECEEKCIPCEEQRTCNVTTQNDCGLGERDPAYGGVCAAHYICVPKENNCKYQIA